MIYIVVDVVIVLIQLLYYTILATFHSLRLWKIQKDTVESYHILVALHIYIRKMSIGLNISPPLWQSYINTILDCLQSRI